MKKSIITTVICLFVTISAFAYSGGNGTEQYPYLISSKANMEELATNVNGGQKYAGVYFLLTRDLTNESDVISTIIGNSDTRFFSGIFDGGGYEIKVNISTTGQYIGVFGCISGATIKNLRVVGSINSVGRYAGSICGYSSSSMISNCCNVGNILTSQSYLSSDISFYSYSYSGGICGYSSSTSTVISNCYNSGNISSSNHSSSSSNSSTTYSHSYSGGICGYTSSTISNCYNTGKISSNSEFYSVYSNASSYTYSYSGGICGYSSSNSVMIGNCYNTGNISTTATSSYKYSSNNSYSGGISGEGGKIQNCFVSNCQIANNNDIPQSRIGRIGGSDGTYTNCYSDILSVSINGNPIGSQNANSKNGKDISATNFQNQSWLQSTLNWDFVNIWTMSNVSSTNQGLPILKQFQQEYTISVSAGANGFISPATDQTVAPSGSLTFSFWPKTGYEIDQVLIDGVNNATAISAGSYTFENVTENHSISVSFKSIYTIDELLAELATANETIGILQSENATLQSQLNTANNTISDLESQLSECLGFTFIPSPNVESVQIYPNPVKNHLYFQSEFPIQKIEIYDPMGKLLYLESKSPKKVDVSSFAEGSYFVRIYGEDWVNTQKLIVVR